MTKSRNKYDYLLIFTIALLVFGGFGGAMQPIRLFSLAMIPYVFWLSTKKRKLFSVYIVVLVIYLLILLSLFWTSDLGEGFKEAVYYAAHLNLFVFTILLYDKANKPFESLIAGWSIFIFLTQIVAFNEIFFDKHLSLSIFESEKMINVGGMSVQKKFASVTFGNYNGYVTVVAFALPFLFAAFIISKTKKLQLASLSILVFALFSLFINASRGGILSAAVIGFVFGFFHKRLNLKNQRFNALLIAPVLMILIIKYFNVIFEQILFRQVAGSALMQDDSRTTLFSAAISAFLNKPLFGGGIGSLQKEMEGAAILLPHNMFLEVLVQFGIVFFMSFIFYIFYIFISGIRSRNNVVKFIIVSALLSLPITSIINSGYLLMPVLWIFFSSLYCVSRIKSD